MRVRGSACSRISVVGRVLQSTDSPAVMEEYRTERVGCVLCLMKLDDNQLPDSSEGETRRLVAQAIIR